MSETIDGWEVVSIEPGLWCLRRPGYSAEIQASADGDNIDIADDAGRRWLYPPVAAVERLLALRRAALAPEAQAPSGEPWRPAVGERCLLFANGEWRLAERIEDEYNGVRRYRSLTASHAAVTWFEVPEYDGIRPLGSLPVPPSCGGEPEARERADRPAVASERHGLARLLEWARAKLTEESAEMREYPERGRDAFEECVDEIEREIAALGPPSIADQGIDDAIRAAESHRGDFGQGGPEGFSDYSRGWRDGLAELRTILRGREIPPSIAEDLRTPEPGAFAGAVLVGSEAARNRRQAEVGEWAFATFGEISYHHGERVTRLLEEAVELAQAEGLDELSAMDVVHRVFEKPAGDWRKDVGAVGVTLLAYCHSRQVSADEREAAEWDRVKAIDPETMRARQNAKAAAGYGLQAVRP